MESRAISRQHRVSVDRLCYFFLIFLAGCFVGWIYEEIFYWVTEGLLRNRGILGLVFHYLLEPMGEKLYRRIPDSVIHIVCLILIALFIADCILSFLFRTPITY
ncbi:MAG: putative ABC transporter permease [Lachnospiraceae bacterium]|nr:putative ABC transporter permease [Lachnospiraceae bacterium]